MPAHGQDAYESLRQTPLLHTLLEVHDLPSSQVVPSGLGMWTHTPRATSQTPLTQGPPRPVHWVSLVQPVGGGGQAQYWTTVPAVVPPPTVRRSKPPGALASSSDGSKGPSGGWTGIRAPCAAPVPRSICCT